MKPFLECVIDELFEKYPDKIGDLCLVLPNRRAGLFIKQYIAKKTNKPVFLPELFGIEDFVNHFAPNAIPDDLILLHELYKAYCEVNKEKPQTFDHFYQWGNVLFHDFNDIDYNLADAKTLFYYLSEEKKIEEWTPENHELSAFQRNYLQFYESLYLVYTQYKTQLFALNMAYQGMNYRYVAENISHLEQTHTWHKIIFIGFNALTASEEQIIDVLIQSEKACIYWDSDEYYIKPKVQEAGNFLRQHQQKSHWGEFKWSFNHFKEDKKNIILYGIAQNIMQVKTAGNLLSEIAAANNDLTKTAIVLADENLLIPLLHSLPEDISQCNVTMGYSLALHNFNEFIMQQFSLFENCRQQQFHFQDIINTFSNAYFRMFSGINQETCTDCINTFHKHKKLFYAASEIADICTSVIDSLKKENDETTEELKKNAETRIQQFFNLNNCNALPFLLNIKNISEHILNLIASTSKNKINIIDEDKEFIFQFSKVLSHLSKIVKSLPTDIELHTLRQMMQQIIKNTSVAFYGEPLSGLQIMGMLETRTLDFENIILLSVNEDILPKSKLQPSFVPYNIRKIFKLPTFIERDAIFAYHFYRLLQRAKQVHLIYNTESGNLSSGEKSRFISQIQEELPQYNPSIHITQKNINLPNLNAGIKPQTEIIKNEKIISELLLKLQDGFSPSALSTYITCPLKFFYQYCLGLKEPQPISANLDAREFGNVLHLTLENLYKPYIASPINQQILQHIKQNAEAMLEAEFAKMMSGIQQETGSMRITKQVAKKIIADYLHNEFENLKEPKQQYLLENCELKICCNLNISANNKIYPIKLQGKIDKLMSQSFGSSEKTLIIADYKTGIIIEKELKFNDWRNIINDTEKLKIFQLLCYASILTENNDIHFDYVKSGIIPLRNNKSLFMPVTFEELTEVKAEKSSKKSGETTFEKIPHDNFPKSAIKSQFYPLLVSLLTEILTLEIPFSATTDEKQCEYCPYKSVCFKS